MLSSCGFVIKPRYRQTVPHPVTDLRLCSSPMDSSARRDSLLRLLRRRGPWRVAHLAAELRVSRRTVLRDLASLRARGFEIRGEGGPGGGVQLDPRSVLLSSQLAADEVVSLILSVAVMKATPGIPFAQGAERALAKIEAALPVERVRDLRRLMRRILVGHPARLEAPMAASAVDRSVLPAFERAFTGSLVMRFEYLDRGARRSSRRIEPHGLLVRTPLWYVVAWDIDKDSPRLFRMDRMRHPVVTDTRFGPRPVDLVSGVCPDGTAHNSSNRSPFRH
jgi:predicted DNA-binding transcriptional regulator YafY